jgi:TonB family protein
MISSVITSSIGNAQHSYHVTSAKTLSPTAHIGPNRTSPHALRNLLPRFHPNNLNRMALRLLLFSSDENTALVLRQVLEELEFQVEHCSESLDAVEKVTTRNFDVIIVDWADDPEAGFLLKTAGELKSTKESVALAVLPVGTTAAAALKMGAHETLKKPIIPSQVMDTLRTVRDVLVASHGGSSETARRSPKHSQHPDLDQEFIGLASKIAADLPRQNTETNASQAEDEVEEFVPAPPAPIVARPKANSPAADEHRPSQAPRYTGSLFSSLPYSADSPPEPSPTKSVPVGRRKFHSRVAILSASLAIAALLYAWAPGSSFSERMSSMKLSSVNIRSMITRLSSLVKADASTKAVQTKPDPTTPNKSSAHAANAAQQWPLPQVDPFQVATDKTDHGAASPDAATAGATQTVSTDESSDNIQVIPVMDTSTTIADSPATTSAASSSDSSVPGQPSPARSPGQAASAQSASGLPAESPQTATSASLESTPPSSTVPTSASTLPPQSPASRVAVPDSLKTPGLPNRASTSAKVPALTAAPGSVPSSTSSLHALTVFEHNSEHASKLSAGLPAESVLTKTQSSASLLTAKTGTPGSSANAASANLSGSLKPLVLSEETSRELLLTKVQPVYPSQAARTGLQGAVVLQALIARDGSVRDLKLIRGYLVFGRAAFDAVKQWRYKPYILNGQAVETQTQITVNFKPPS